MVKPFLGVGEVQSELFRSDSSLGAIVSLVVCSKIKKLRVSQSLASLLPKICELNRFNRILRAKTDTLTEFLNNVIWLN